MTTCPNTNSDDWKALVRKYKNHGGLDLVKAMYIKNDERIPTLSEAKKLTGLITEEDVHKASKIDLKPLPLSEDVLTTGLSNISNLQKINDKAILALSRKLEIQDRGNLTEDEKTEKVKFINDLKKLEVKDSLLKFVAQAAKSTSIIYKEYTGILDQITNGTPKEEVLTPSTLDRWKDYLSAYDELENIQSEFQKEGWLDRVDGKENPLNTQLADTIKLKNTLTKLYQTEGLKMVAKALAPHYGKIYRDFEIDKSREYDSLTDEQKSGLTKKQWIEGQLEANKDDNRQKTEDYLTSQLETASKDINLLQRWMETTLNASDPVVSAAANAIQKASFKSHALTLDAKIKLMTDLKAVEKAYGKTNNFRKLYDKLLEKDENGNYTGRLVDRFGGKFWDKYDENRNKIDNNDTLTEKEKVKLKKKWLKENTHFDGDKFNDDKIDVINKMIKGKRLTTEEVHNLEINETLSRYGEGQTPSEMHDNGLLSYKAKEELQDWIAKHSWDYRSPNMEWQDKNPQWKQFEKLSKNENDPMVKFYRTLKDMEQEANNMLGNQGRLRGGRLPSIMRSNSERLAYGDPIKYIVSNEGKKLFNVTADDNTRGNSVIQNEQGQEVHFIPTYYNGKLDQKDQSYDLGTIYLKFYQMAAEYSTRREILPEMKMAQFFVNHRDVNKTDSKGNPITNTFKALGDKINVNVPKPKGKNHLADQFNDFFDMVMYGIKEVNQGSINIFGHEIDLGKAANAMNKFTSINLLAWNFRAMVNNVALVETLQASEALAGQYMSIKSYNKANKFYAEHMMGLLKDIGQREPTGLLNKLYEHFQAAPEPLETSLKNNTLSRAAMTSNSLFFLMKSGYFFEQSRLFLGMLADKEAFNSEGKSLGSMLDHYKIVDGKLTLNPDVDLKKSNWSQEEQQRFSFKVQGMISSVHGEYSDIAKSAIQRYAVGRMAIMLRKYIVPGFQRRWKSKAYVERMGDYTEGNYRTAVRYLRNLWIDFTTAGNSIDWMAKDMTVADRANLVRTMTEVAALVATSVMAGVCLSTIKNKNKDSWYDSFMAYQFLRLKSELLFFSNPNETMKILQSPATSMALWKTTGKLVHYMFAPTATDPEGKNKLLQTVGSLTPGYKSYQQFRDMKKTLNLMNQ